jgi:hypothetical protein
MAGSSQGQGQDDRDDPGPHVPLGLATPPGAPAGVWPDICGEFGLRLLVLAEQLRAALDELESDENDPTRLRRLYQADHALTRMRRASRDLRTLAGRTEEDLAGFTTSLLDVVRMAASAIERYTQVSIGRVSDLAVLGYAADDVASLMAALLDNATRYSPGAVSVSGHLLEDGGVAFRVEDTGLGIGEEQVAALNAAFAGPVPPVDERTGRHTGFAVVHRIARKHSIGIRLAARPLPAGGTVALVTLPPRLLCEVPAEQVRRERPPADESPGSAEPSAFPEASEPGEAWQTSQTPAVTGLPRRESARPRRAPQWAPPELPDGEQGSDKARTQGELPRRTRTGQRRPGREPAQEPAATLEPVPMLQQQKSRRKAQPATQEQQSAARHAFADDLDAFALGTSGGPDGTQSAGHTESTGHTQSAGHTADASIEEGAKP